MFRGVQWRQKQPGLQNCRLLICDKKMVGYFLSSRAAIAADGIFGQKLKAIWTAPQSLFVRVQASSSNQPTRMEGHMKIVVIGGTGLIGSKVVANLRQKAHEVVAAAPNTGVNTITGEG